MGCQCERRLPTRKDIELLLGLISQSADSLLYGPNLLIKAFAPDHKLAKKYSRPPLWSPTVWRESLVAMLAASPEDRSKLLAAHMGRWNRLMKPYGWKTKK